MLNATNELISLRLAATDLHGNAITQIEQGESFLIKAYMDDRRDELDLSENGIAWGVYAAYFNITFDSEGFEFDPTYGDGGVKYGPNMSPVDEIPPIPDTSYDGYIEGLAVQNVSGGYIDEIEALSFRMIAQTPNVYDMAEAFTPHFHFDQIDLVEDPNVVPDLWEPYYIDGVPQVERLTGQAFYNAVDLADESFLLHLYDSQRITSDSEVYFEGVDLEVIAASSAADYQLRYVTKPTLTSNGEVNNLPTNVEVIDEWNHIYVEVYAQAPAGSAIQAGIVEISYDAADFGFVRAIGRVEDPANLRYSVTSTDVDEENGTVRVGFSSLSTNLGDDRYALVGRIQLKSNMELPVDYTNGPLTFTPSSEITLSDTNATVIDDATMVLSVINGTATASHSFEVWPVIYDVGANGEDRKVGISDFAGFIGQYGRFVNNDPLIRKFDFNNNGKVDLADFSLFIQNYGESDDSVTFRDYPTGYPGTIGGVPLMASSFVLEGEQVDARSTPQTTTSPTMVTTEDKPSTISGQSLSNTLPLTQSASTGSSSDDASQDNQVVTPEEETTDAAISSLDDQTDLIIMSSQNSESSFALDDDEPEFADHADEVLAIWEDENNL
ncbi:hypothetical protein HOV93_22290 [Planctomycetes bacterium FF15]|uniref:EF-hand domain-containing protein n=2 Tax=Bremerella alba TaxID=980252 RepID=A0A7V9A768_9BACT|nr:hypothetical protein [Bremerella alba]